MSRRCMRLLSTSPLRSALGLAKFALLGFPTSALKATWNGAKWNISKLNTPTWTPNRLKVSIPRLALSGPCGRHRRTITRGLPRLRKLKVTSRFPVGSAPNLVPLMLTKLFSLCILDVWSRVLNWNSSAPHVELLRWLLKELLLFLEK